MTNSAGVKGSPITSTLPFVLLFFISMVFHELALESINVVYSQPPYSFRYLTSSITLFQFGFCVILPTTLSVTCAGGDVIRNFPREWKQFFVYVKLSAVVYGATALATMSLGYSGVTYVTKVVFKSAKLIPTMIVGVIMDTRAIKAGNKNVKKKHYSVWDYGSALLLCVGAAGFCLSPKSDEDALMEDAKSDEIMERVNNTQGPHWIGISLLIGSVFCDAFVPNISEQLMQQGATGGRTKAIHRKVSGDDDDDEEVEMKSLLSSNNTDTNNSHYEQSQTRKKEGLSSASLMVNTNSIGFCLLFLSTIISSQLLPIVTFMAVHPHFLLLHLVVGSGLGTAVLAYTELIKRSGPAFAVAVATLRKVVTVFLSYIIFPKAMHTHFASSCLVLAGIVVGFIGKRRR
eukprot:scaffold5399_cov147-Skeletonema_menzelii.AAC.4